MNDKDKHFIERYEELLDKGYCDCNEMNCIDNNSPRRILDIEKKLQFNWNSLREWFKYGIEEYSTDDGFVQNILKQGLDKMNELENLQNK